MIRPPFPDPLKVSPKGVIVPGYGVRCVAGLANFLGCPVIPPWRWDLRKDENVVLAWGFKPSARRAARLAARLKLPLWRLEDGFLRSIGLGTIEGPLSVVVDDLGIYYDASAPSRLELEIPRPLDAGEHGRTQNLIRAWRAGRLSKYNHARDYAGLLPERFVLVVDQTLGDVSINLGKASKTSFTVMLEAALAENPDATIVLKSHPQVMSGKRRGHFDLSSVARQKRVFLLGEDVHPVSLIEQAQAIYTVTSQMGFEGLLWGKPVRTFGMPFYAGWGLTQDALNAPARRKPIALENLVHAALVDYPRYLDPETGRRCGVERVMEWMSLQRRMRNRFPRKVYAAGFSRWKKPIVRSYLAGSRVEFIKRVDAVPAGNTLMVWGRKALLGQIPKDVQTVRLEDGFLRSVGLGADLIRPLSWVMDRQGIYYDATEASDLEQLLQTTVFDPEVKERAAHLRQRIVEAGLTKYNVGRSGWKRSAGARQVILVPGQVESDASIRFGAPEISTNLGLLRTVREENPGAWIIYKPHPDVMAGLRKPGANEDDARQWCDEWVTDVEMSVLLNEVDEIHVLTSLAGFEALLRGKKVVCHGQPFYAGWGLTEDRCPISRRTRQLDLDELVAGVLLLYPAYLSQATGRFTTPERTLDELIAWRASGVEKPPLWRRGLRWVLRRRAN